MPVHIEARGYVPCIKDGKPNKEPGEELQGGRVLPVVGRQRVLAQMDLSVTTPPLAREGEQRPGCEDLISPDPYTAY